MKLDEVRVVHALQGRVRLKVDTLRVDPELARKVETRLSMIRGMLEVKINPLTGSVLMCFDPALFESIDFHLAVAGALGIAPSDLDPAYLATWATSATSGANFAAAPPVSSELWRALIPLTLLALGLRSLLVSDKLLLPNWYEYTWYGFAAHSMLNPPAK
jgi:hypothetical protein